MKVFTYISVIIALALIIFNITQLDLSNVFEGESIIALIGIIASLCAILILLILRVSKTIDEKIKNQ